MKGRTTMKAKRKFQYAPGIFGNLLIMAVIMSGLSADSILAVQKAGDIERSCATVEEPTMEEALGWWPEQTGIWTPIGWRSHLFRFDVYYNGMIIAHPHASIFINKPHTKKYSTQGIAYVPLASSQVPENGQTPVSQDSVGFGNQGMTDNATPVIWNQWNTDTNATIRQYVFSHMETGKEVESGVEPIYAWIRYKVKACSDTEQPEMLIQLSTEEILGQKDQAADNAEVDLKVRDQRAYPRILNAQANDKNHCLYVTEPEDKVRLICLPSKSAECELIQPNGPSGQSFLVIKFNAQKGAYVDVLLPMLPSDKDVIEKELALGRKNALAESDKYWSDKPATAAVIDVPEKQVNEAIERSIQYAQIVAERNPDKGEYTFLTGSGRYDMVWPTPCTFVGHMLLDPMGYHEFVARHIEVFRKHQGQIKPNGPTYKKHPGHYSVPDGIVGFRWIADHGAVLYEATKHALISNDKQFLDDWTDSIIKACEFIKHSLARSDHDGIKGLMPTGQSTDEGHLVLQATWNDGWNYKGLVTAVRFLRRIKHPRASEFAAVAEDYKKVFVETFRKRTETMPTWTDKNGVEHKMIPRYFQGGSKTETTHGFYLDSGPLALVWMELFEADDPLMVSCLEFFRNGPNRAKWDVNNRSPFQPPCLVHEISSCEPVYSWNIYHNWQKGDRSRYLEGMYALLTGGMSMQTYIGGEVRHGTYGMSAVGALLVDLVKLAVVDDVVRESELHLLRLVPRVWLREDYLTRFENIATEYGQVTVKFKLQDKGETLNVQFKPNFHTPPSEIILHVPPVKGLQYIDLNGEKIKVKPGRAITISNK